LVKQAKPFADGRLFPHHHLDSLLIIRNIEGNGPDHIRGGLAFQADLHLVAYLKIPTVLDGRCLLKCEGKNGSLSILG